MLERFQASEELDARNYEFTEEPEGESKNELENARRDGRIVSVNLPMKVLAPSRWAGFDDRERQIISGLSSERTRHKSHGKVRKQRVPGSSVKEIVKCPFLDPDAEYIVFGGNGKRPGFGYRIVGAKKTGWLVKCGYKIEHTTDNQLASHSREFLRSLDQLSQDLGIIHCGFHPKTKGWLGCEGLLRILGSRRGYDQLEQWHLRVYAPANIDERLRNLIAERGGFTRTLENDESCKPEDDLLLRIMRLGVRHEDLANYLKVSRPFVTKLLNGKSSWPPNRLRQVHEWLLEQESGYIARNKAP